MKIIMWSHSLKSRKLCWYTPENLDCIMLKYNFEDEFRVRKVAGTAKRGRTTEPQELTRKYTSRQKISAAKKKDLVSFCRSGIIPSEEDSDQE